MKAYRKIGTLLLIIFIIMQFIQPMKNRANGLDNNDISKVYVLPAEVHDMFVKKCYDCHSNNTRYPWYFNIQPIGWWLAAHVHDGKEELNFSEFQSYDQQKRLHKLEELGEVVTDRSMPLKTYTTFHQDSEITPADEQAVKDWLRTVMQPVP
jgi:hypothetical protein